MTKNHLENDLKKVSESHFGYIINIMRNANFSTRSSGRNIAMWPPERQSISPLASTPDNFTVSALSLRSEVLSPDHGTRSLTD
jgi:hypothetical protein